MIIAESSLTTRSATYSEVETLAVSHILAIVKLTHLGSFLPSSDWLIMLDHRVKHTNVRLSRLIHRNNHILICIRLCILLQELRINFCRFFLKFIYRQLWFWPQVFEAILMRRIYNNFVHDNKLLCMHWLNKFEHWLPDWLNKLSNWIHSLTSRRMLQQLTLFMLVWHFLDWLNFWLVSRRCNAFLLCYLIFYLH